MRTVDLSNMDPRLRISRESVVQCVHYMDVFGRYRVRPGDLEVAFVDEKECRRLHRAFFDDPELTDVMTFPGDPEDDHAGDIAICPAAAWQAGKQSGLSFPEELTLYLVHAWLHLSGLDDREEDDRRAMRRAESDLMNYLGRHDAILKADWCKSRES